MLDIKSIILARKMFGGSTGGGGSSNLVAWVNFYNENGSIKYGQRAVIKGDDCPNPINEGLFATPTKEPTQANTYTFEGWSTSIGGSTNSFALVDITQDTNLYATFEENVRYYSVRFYDGETLLKTESVAYNNSITYSPTKSGYLFQGWNPKPTNVTSDLDCYAQWVVDDGLIRDDWDEIYQSTLDGTYSSKYSVGNTKDLVINYADGTSETIPMKLAKFDYKGACYEEGASAMPKMVFVATKLLKDDQKCYYDPANIGVKYWQDMSLYSYLNGEFLNYLPTKLQNILKETYFRSASFGIKRNGKRGKVFCPTMIELWGENTSSGGSNYSFNYNDGDTLTGALSTGSNKLKTKVGVTTSSDYWFGLSRNHASNGTYHVYSDGSNVKYEYSYSTTKRSVLIAFAIG